MSREAEASADFEEAARLTHAELADRVAEYALLKTADRLTKDGEVIDRKKANKREERLNAEIKKGLGDHGETELYVEGVGTVRLRDTDSVGYRLDAMDNLQLASLINLNLLSVKRTEVMEQVDGTTLRQYKPPLAWLKEYEVRGRGSTQLLFEEEGSK